MLSECLSNFCDNICTFSVVTVEMSFMLESFLRQATSDHLAVGTPLLMARLLRAQLKKTRGVPPLPPYPLIILETWCSLEFATTNTCRICSKDLRSVYEHRLGHLLSRRARGEIVIGIELYQETKRHRQH